MQGRGKQNLGEREIGFCRKSWGGRGSFALAYPNFYRVGMSNLGLHVVYRLMNERADTVCERFFLPEKALATGEVLSSMESHRPLHRFDIIGFAVSFEMDYGHILQMLWQGKVNPLAVKRTDFDPLLIAGGPCATFNPEPLADFFDAFVIGEGEVVMPGLLDAYYEAKAANLRRQELIESLAQAEGVYVPSLYRHHYDKSGRLSEIETLNDAPVKVKRQWVKNLDEYPAHTEVITDEAHFNLYLIETARGCGRHCRFCMAGYAFRPPRVRSLGALEPQIAAARQYGKRLGLMGAAISDHPDIDALCEHIARTGLAMSVASFRADSVTERLVKALAESGQKTLTLAPEAGSAKMRAVVNKGIEEAHLFGTISMGLEAGIRRFRLYFMIGLPYETEEDTAAIVDLALRLYEFMLDNGGEFLTLSINPFVPKPVTPFQWLPMASKKNLNHAIKFIRQKLKNCAHLDIISESVKAAYIQGILARGDRRLGKALLCAQERGGIDVLPTTMRDLGLEADEYLYRERQFDEIFPWDTIDLGVKREYLLAELHKAEMQSRTVPCFDGCARCGVCLEGTLA